METPMYLVFIMSWIFRKIHQTIFVFSSETAENDFIVSTRTQRMICIFESTPNMPTYMLNNIQWSESFVLYEFYKTLIFSDVM